MVTKYKIMCNKISQIEIIISVIFLDLEKPLQKEDLGVFYKGVLKPITEESKISIECTGKPVTIKTANPSSGLHCLQSILKEVKVMLYLGKHANIAHLVGCCTENLNQGWFKYNTLYNIWCIS